MRAGEISVRPAVAIMPIIVFHRVCGIFPQRRACVLEPGVYWSVPARNGMRVLEKRKLKIVVTWFLVKIGKADSGAVNTCCVFFRINKHSQMFGYEIMEYYIRAWGRVALNTSWRTKDSVITFTQRNFSRCLHKTNEFIYIYAAGVNNRRCRPSQ